MSALTLTPAAPDARVFSLDTLRVELEQASNNVIDAIY